MKKLTIFPLAVLLLSIFTPVVFAGDLYVYLQYDGDDDYVVVDDSASLNMTGGDMTVELWVRTDTAQDNTLLAKGAETASNGWEVYITRTPSEVIFFVSDGIGGDNEIAFEYTYEDDSWHHYLFEFNNTDDSLWIWIDGVYSATFSDNPTADYDTSGDLYIGCQPGPPVENFLEGDIDEVRVYSRRLTQAEITYSFTNMEPQDQTDLELWLRFNEGTGATAYDETTNDNDGTLMPNYAGGNAPEWVDETPVVPAGEPAAEKMREAALVVASFMTIIVIIWGISGKGELNEVLGYLMMIAIILLIANVVGRLG